MFLPMLAVANMLSVRAQKRKWLELSTEKLVQAVS